MKAMSQQLFVSHATKDDDTVTRLCRELSAAAGCTFWVDHHNLKPPEDNWRQAIQNALRASDAGLLVLSRNSVSRPEIVSEWTYLLNLRRGLYLAKIDDVPIEEIDYRLHLVQWVDLSRDWEAGIRALAAAMRNEPAPENAPVMLVRPVTGRIDRKLLTIPIEGRSYGLWALTTRLKQGPTTVLGVGGIGKSRVAAEVMMTSPDIEGAVWQPCSDVSQPEEVLALLREHFSLPATASRSQTLQPLRRNKRLVVIDHADAVPDERRVDYIGLIDELFQAGAQVLLTSRTEWTEFDSGETYRPQRPSRATAAKIVRAMQDVFHTPHNLAPFAERIADAARQHPGLIEWAVKQTRRFPPEKVIRDLRSLKHKQVQSVLDEMIHKTLRQMAWREGTGVRKALRRLVVFRGGFSYEAMQALLDEDESTEDHYLDVLQTWQFVKMTVIDGATRYWVDSLVVDCVEPDETAMPAHLAYYKALAEQHHASRNYQPLVPEIANLEAAKAHDAEFGAWLDSIWADIVTAKME